MNIRFTGDLPLWLVLTLALSAAVGSWWIYQTEMRGRPRRSILAPLLRAAALIAIVLILSGPALVRSRTLEDKSRVLVFVDGSASMGTDDRYLPVEQKLLIARGHGWLSPDALDVTLWDAAERLSQARGLSSAARRPGSPISVLQSGCTDFASATADVAKRLEQVKSDPVIAAERERFIREVVAPAGTLAERRVDRDNQIQIRQQLTALNQSAGEVETALRDAFARIARTAAGTPDVAAAIKHFDSTNRWQRASDLLLDPKIGLLGKLSGKHDIEILALGANGEARPVWSTSTGTPPAAMPPLPATEVTNLASGLQSRAGGESDQRTRTTVVLLSDGHDNADSPLQALGKAMKLRQIAIHTVSLGDPTPRPDLSVVLVRHNPVVLRDDIVRGTVLIDDRMPPGSPFVLKVDRDGKSLWQQEMKTDGSGSRSVSFHFPLSGAPDAAAADVPASQPTDSSAGPVSMTVSVSPVPGEDRDDNNQQPMVVVHGANRDAKILILDGRPRWEARYVRNLFVRDKNWKANIIIAATEADLKSGDTPGTFPTDKAKLFAYDLVVFGDMSSKVLGPERLEWLREFVQVRGGGMILIDGQRQHLRDYAGTPLASLLPVAWSTADSPAPSSLNLTTAGASAPFLVLTEGYDENQAIWKSFRPPTWVSRVLPLPGADVLAEAVAGDDRTPVLVMRRSGAGQVLFSAFDQSWRWRHEVADLYHQRYWNQVASSVMEPPYALTTPLFSLDAGELVHKAGDIAAIRARIRDDKGNPVPAAKATAILYRQGKEVATVSLTPDADTGVLRGKTPPLIPGKYELALRADELREDQSRQRLDITVVPQQLPETTQLEAQPERLRQMAEASEGQFLLEQNADRLAERIEPQAVPRTIETETRLANTYWWFAPIVVLLGLEFALRKRAGLL